MTKETFYGILGGISNEYIIDAQTYKPKKSHWIKRGIVAACLCMAIIAEIALSFLRNSESTAIISGYDTDVTSSYHSTPEPGTYFCYVDVNMAREYYKGENVIFLLAIDIYNASDEERAAEYQRLIELGYTLYETERWTFSGEGEKKYETVVVGAFTEGNLSNFDANEEYGYVFHFVSNGDGSSISVGKDDLITDFYATVGTAICAIS